MFTFDACIKKRFTFKSLNIKVPRHMLYITINKNIFNNLINFFDYVDVLIIL